MIHPPGSRPAPANDGVASWYTPGPVDGFGDRLLMFDNTGNDSLELLRFYPSLAATAGFEAALRERVQQIGQIPDHAFPLIVAVERLDGDSTLALVSTHVPGKRLSAFFERPVRRSLNPLFVTGLITQVVKALTVLQSKGHDISHGALAPDRIVVTSGGRVCVVEHVLGSALRRLDFSASQLWSEFGLVTAPDPSGTARLDARTDVFQLGVLALELLLGRRLTRLELEDRLPDLLDQWSTALPRVTPSSGRLRVWLERALQVGHQTYQTAADAYEDLRGIPSESMAAAFELLAGEVDGHAGRQLQPAQQATGEQTAPVISPARPPAREGTAAVAPPPQASLRPPQPLPDAAHIAAPAVRGATARRPALEFLHASPWIAAALGLLALVQTGVIAALVMRRPATTPVTARAAEPSLSIAGFEPASAPATSPAAAIPAVAVVEEPPPAPSAPDPIAAASNQLSGGVRLETPIELKVLHGDQVLGSTADGPIVMRAGTYQLDLINTALGLRIRRGVTFRSGQMATLSVTLPMGQVSVNAQPWAEVSIDNQVYGETPLANLAVPIGDHEIVFRHPELGERRQMITVRADGPTRVRGTFDR